MAVIDLKGWSGDRLDRLEDDVSDIKISQAKMEVHVENATKSVATIAATLEQMQESQFKVVQKRLNEVEGRPRLWMLAVGAPVLISALGVVLSHANLV